jgi:hypothetical protein
MTNSKLPSEGKTKSMSFSTKGKKICLFIQ